MSALAKIHVLDKHTAELIAAGEVVERPSSVIKEMVENALDAGATRVTVEIKNGGISYIRISDNGCGIAKDDVANAFLRHATSKIQTETDLEAIETLGFRGEALASIAAVTRLELLTKTKEEQFGTCYRIEGGEEISCEDIGCPEGCTFLIRDLFYNTPARMKFLKTHVAEGNAVADVMDRLALSHPSVAFQFIRDGKKVLSTSGDGKLFSAIYSVFGKEFAEQLLPVDYTNGAIRLTGFTVKPVAARKNRSMQLFFINKRFIKTGTGAAALQEAYKNSIMVGKFPAGVYHLEFPFSEIDVNVHPAKIEVRFSNERIIFETIYYGVKNALEKSDVRPTVSLPIDSAVALPMKENSRLKAASTAFQKPVSQQKPMEPLKNKQSKFTMVPPTQPPKPIQPVFKDVSPTTPKPVPAKPVGYQPSVTGQSLNVIVEESLVTNEKPSVVQKEVVAPQPKSEPIPDVSVKVLGEAFKTYIFAQVDERILIIDKHAAHERILFDRLKENMGSQSAQMLLQPITLTFRKTEYTLLLENQELLANAGLIIEPFGDDVIRLCSVPMNLDKEDIHGLMEEIVEKLGRGIPSVYVDRLDWLFHSIACRSAVKGGKQTSIAELETLAKRIAADDSVRYCPHGRPVAMWMSKSQLEKQFGRS